MAPFIPVACGVATALTLALAVETGKGTKKVIERRKKRNAKKAARS